MKNRVFISTGLWCVSLYFIASYFSISNKLDWIDLVYSLFFHCTLWLIVGINVKWLIPGLLEKKRYVVYVLGLGISIYIGLLVHSAIFDQVLPMMQDYFFIVSFTETRILAIIFIAYLLLSTLLVLSQSWFQLQQVRQEKLAMELSTLRSQVNPHFLFNGLNSIYSLALNHEKKTSDAVLQLSDLLRYSLYETQEETVRLSREVDQLNNYLALQKLRQESTIELSFEVVDIDDSAEIHPMLLMPLMENAFKHGPQGIESGFIRFKLEMDDSTIKFLSVNSMTNYEVARGGIGLQNLRNRLDLYYGKDYSLVVNAERDTFEVKLNIPIQ